MSTKEKLLEMLTWMRPHGSAVEKEFVKTYITDVHKHTLLGPMENVLITTDPNSDTLFSCHTDTVHRMPGIQEVRHEDDFLFAYKADKEPLGADDTTGVWLMLAMIEANVPGFYVFHRGEECGGIGSSWLARNRADWLKQFKRAVAFDRKGESSVITHQRGGSCCSQEFALALAKSLGPEWQPDSGGTFTDTANYMPMIPECTNLSVGYYDQHTDKETQNIAFALSLVPLLIAVKWEELPVVRTPKEPDSFSPYDFRSRLYDNWASHGKRKKHQSQAFNPGYYHGFPHTQQPQQPIQRQGSVFDGLGLEDGDRDELERSKATDMAVPPKDFELVSDDKDEFADILDMYADLTDDDWADVPSSKVREVIAHDQKFVAELVVDLAARLSEQAEDYYALELENEKLEKEIEILALRLKRLTPRSARIRN
jgi:hypothetical protein